MTAGAVSASASASPDAALIHLHAECVRLEREFEEVCSATQNDETPGAEYEAANDAATRAVARLAATPAQTVVGVHLKLKFARSADILDVGAIPAGDLVISALRDAERLSEVADTPDPIVDLIAQYHEAVVTINAIEVKDGPGGDAEVDEFCDEVFDPLRETIMTTRPTTRAGLAGLLDLAVNADDVDYSESWMMPEVIVMARDAVKGAALGVMAPPANDPIITLWAEWSGLINYRGPDDLDGEAMDRAIKAAIVRIDEIELQIMSAPVQTLPAALAQIDVLNHWDEEGPPVNGPLVSTRARHKEHVRAELRRLTDAQLLTGNVVTGAEVEDSIFGLIAALERARAAIAAKKEHIAPLRAKIPTGVRNSAEWYERVGMPFTPETEDAFWEADFEAANNAEAAVIEGEAVTPAGLAAKAACLWWVRSRDEGRPNYLEAVEAHGRLSDEAVLAAFARDAAALFEWPEVLATDAPNVGSAAIHPDPERPMNGGVS